MNDHQEHKRSRIIPRWLEYDAAAKMGELAIPKKNRFETNAATKESITSDLEEFTIHPTSFMACRLMGAGIIVGDFELSHDMAAYIQKHGGVDSLSASLADRILNEVSNVEPIKEVDVRIANIRKWTSQYHNDAIAWIELARAFTIKGLKEKAKKAVITAIQIAPYDRYIVRCAARFFLHISDYESAWHYVNRASKFRFDPWIRATEVNVANISERDVPNFKRLIPNDLSHEQLFHFSELIESYAYLELEAGNDRKARKQMRIAWENPSENVITHAEWVIRNRLPGLKASSIALKFSRSPEANTWQTYCELKENKAMEAAREWELQEPYSKYPFIVGTCIACNADKPHIGVEIAKRGLIIEPNNKIILNNLCYALLRSGDTVGAGEYIKRIYSKDGTISDLIALATKGLYEYKTNNIAKGREDYIETIQKLRQQGEPILQASALLNMAMAELDASTTESREFAKQALSNTEGVKVPDVQLVRKIVQRKLEQ